MTHEQLRKLIADTAPTILADLMTFDIHFGWQWERIGFGELYIAYDALTGRFESDTECMSSTAVRKMLHAFADHIADRLKAENDS